MRARRFNDSRHLDFAIETQTNVTRRHKQRLLANVFTVAAAMASSSPAISRERWTFERNERRFENTLPKFGELIFKVLLLPKLRLLQPYESHVLGNYAF